MPKISKLAYVEKKKRKAARNRGENQRWSRAMSSHLAFARNLLMLLISRENTWEGSEMQDGRDLLEHLDGETAIGKAIVMWLADPAREEELRRAIAYSEAVADRTWVGQHAKVGRFGVPRVTKRLFREIVKTTERPRLP